MSLNIDWDNIPDHLVFWEDGEAYPTLDGENPCWRWVDGEISGEAIAQITAAVSVKAANEWDNPIVKVKVSNGYWASGEGDGMRNKSPEWMEPEYEVTDYSSNRRRFSREEYVTKAVASAIGSARHRAGEWVIDPQWFVALESSQLQPKCKAVVEKVEIIETVKPNYDNAWQEYQAFVQDQAKKPRKKGQFLPESLFLNKFQLLGLDESPYNWKSPAQKLFLISKKD